MHRRLKILHIEDVPSDAELVDRVLKKAGIDFDKVTVDSKNDYVNALNEFNPDVILSDHSLPAFNSLEALKILREQQKTDIPFILITATVSEEFAVSVMKEGASDYVLKDRLQRLPSAVINALEKFQLDADRQTYLTKIVASEALFNKAETIAEFGTWRLRVNSGTMDWSAGTYPLLGYEKGEVEPSVENFLKNIHADERSPVEDIFINAETTGPAEADFSITDKDGSKKYIHAQFEKELDQNGQVEYIAGFTQDVTRQKLAQIEIQKNIEELQAASEWQSAILNALPPHIVLLNEAGKILAVNDSWRKFTLKNNLGVPRYGIDYSYIAISQKATGLDELSARLIAKGIKEVISGVIEEFSLEYSFYEKQKKVWYQIIVSPLKDKRRKGAVVLHIDITERKIAEELRLQSEANLETIFKNTEIAYVLCNDQNRVVSFNSKAAELCIVQFGKKLKAGANAFGYFPKDKMPNVKEAIARVLNNERVSYETSYRLPDGSARWYEVTWAGIANDKQENIGFILAFKDVTTRKMTEMERESMTADLVQRYKDLEQFTYIVSHNLRAPVANIMALSNMLSTFDFNPAEKEDVLSALDTSIHMLDQITLDLNNILRVHSSMHKRIEPVAFQLLVDDITQRLSDLIKEEKVTIKTNFSAAEKTNTIKTYLHNIFYNLILNGIKYRRPGADTEISISTAIKQDKLEIIFKDNGKGIEEDNLKNLFGFYRRFDTSVEGRGTGLFLVKMQVENLGGAISVESEVGAGTAFKLEFPQN